MFFIQLALLALSASAAYVVNLVEPRAALACVATVEAITAELETIDLNVDPANLNSASNTSVAFVVDGMFEAVNAITLDGSAQAINIVSTVGVSDPDDANSFIQLVNTTYVPVLRSVLSKTIIAKPIFVQDSLPGLDLVKIILADLQRYNTSNEWYLGNLTLGTPPQNLAEVMELRQVVAQAFDEAIAAYSSGTFISSTSSTHSTSASSVKSSSSSTSHVTASSTSTSPPTATSQAVEWAQCGGIGWTGPTSCVSGSVCTSINVYYSQCLLA